MTTSRKVFIAGVGANITVLLGANYFIWRTVGERENTHAEPMASESYCVEGYMRGGRIIGSNSPMRMARDFRVVVSNGQWTVTAVISGRTNGEICTWSYDGTNIACNSVYGKTTNSDPKMNGGYMIVRTGNVPWVTTSEFAEHAWLAFASSRYLQQRKEKAMLPLWNVPRKEDEGKEVPTSWVLNARAPFLPKEVELYQSGKREGLLKETLRESGLLPGSWVRMRFRVDAYTNVARMELPVSFVSEFYIPTQRVTSRVVGTVTNVLANVACDVKEARRATALLWVQDYRGGAAVPDQYDLPAGQALPGTFRKMRGAPARAVPAPAQQTTWMSGVITSRRILFTIGVIAVAGIVFLTASLFRKGE